MWYAYVGGTNPALARSIDGFIASKGNLSDSDIQDIRHRHLSGLDTVARLRVIGDNLSDEVEQIVGMIEARRRSETARAAMCRKPHRACQITGVASRSDTFA